MKKQENEPSKNNVAFRKRYFSQMTSRLMYEEGRRLSISPTEKEVWQELRARVRDFVRESYRTKTFEELMEDMKRYNIKNPFKLSSSTPDKRNYEDNHDICYRLLSDQFKIDRVKWVEHCRRQLLDRVSKQMCRIESVFTELGIWSYQRYPFVIDNRAYFVGMYFPDSKTILEVRKNLAEGTEEYKEQEARLCALGSVCDNLLVIDDDVYNEKRIREELVPQCAKNVVLGCLGYPKTLFDE